jgi:hypothetical protein
MQFEPIAAFSDGPVGCSKQLAGLFRCRNSTGPPHNVNENLQALRNNLTTYACIAIIAHASILDPSEQASMNNPEPNPKIKGAIARRDALTPEQRSEIARKAASARWGASRPRASHEGELNLGGILIPCAVVDGKRFLSERAVTKALGAKRGGSHWRRKRTDGAELPLYLSANNLKVLVDDELGVALKPYLYTPLRGGGAAFGIAAETLPKVLNVYLKARDERKLIGRQREIARTADVLMRGLAEVGIIALVDEATGYQYDRARLALEEILERFIARELMKWAKTFPDEFYKQIFRLKGWKFSDVPHRRPRSLGRLTNNLVYERLAPGVLDELRRITPRDSKGRLKHKYFQRFTEDVGHPRLREHLASEITLMRIFDDGEWDQFHAALNKALPKQVSLPLFDSFDFPNAGKQPLLPPN